MSEVAIAVEGLGKRFYIGDAAAESRPRRALRSVLPRLRPSGMQELWALRDLSFTITQGEAIGVIGRNGAGKSTLLKLLSRITAPTEGKARIRGRVGTLLEVGTGFHPELTGRDNIFLSGTILGMTRAEIARKFDEIVAFAEIDDFIDTPVKRYSSGMYVRLAFAVAAFLEPEILIVDEVLAVGDAAFQRKSLGRLNEASGREGRTVLFVSHNFQAIRAFCKRVLLLDKGKLVFEGPVDTGLEHYLRSMPLQMDVSATALKDRLNRANGSARFVNVTACNAKGIATWQFWPGDTVVLRCGYRVVKQIRDLVFLLQLRSMADGQLVTALRPVISSAPLNEGNTGHFEITLPGVALRPGHFSLHMYLTSVDDVLSYDVIDRNVDLPVIAIVSDAQDKYERQGVVSLPYHLKIFADGHGTPV